MKKLNKRTDIQSNTIETFGLLACGCGCSCNCSCDCSSASPSTTFRSQTSSKISTPGQTTAKNRVA